MSSQAQRVNALPASLQVRKRKTAHRVDQNPPDAPPERPHDNVRATPTQSERRRRGGLWWLETLRRIHAVRRGFGYPLCGRQSDVTGTFSAPVTSPHFKYDDVMTSLDRVCAGRHDNSRTPASRPRRIGGQGPKRPPSSRRERGNGAASWTQNGKQRPRPPLSRAERLDWHDMHAILARIRIGAEPLDHSEE